METKDFFSFGLGGAALLLSVYNTMRAIQADRVSLKVIPKLYWQRNDGGLIIVGKSHRIGQFIKDYGSPGIAIEVVNLSKLTVTIDEIGFSQGRTTRHERASIQTPLRDEGIAWPTRLEPRASVTYRAKFGTRSELTPRPTRAYAKTACGHEALGRNPAILEFI